MAARTARRMFVTSKEPEYFSSMNTTPLIDVLLVLLVMFILTLPISTQKIPVELPSDGSPGAPRVVHRLTIAPNGAYGWDGAAISDAELKARLAVVARDPQAPALVLEADGESLYDRFDKTLAVIKRAGITKLAFAGNERWR